MVALLALAGCSAPLRKQLVENQRPVVRLTYAPVDTTQREFYVYRMYWTGFDADGRVIRFEYAVDPPSDAGADTVWNATTMTTLSFTFSASQPESLNSAQPLPPGLPRLRDPGGGQPGRCTRRRSRAPSTPSASRRWCASTTPRPAP